jgi:hypothetical protein
MIEKDIILLIMNCKKYEKKSHLQKMTWLKEIGTFVKYYHVVADENIEQDFIFDEMNNVLTVKTQDDYNSLPKKVIKSYNAIYETFKFKYIFKTDDDQILLKPVFLNTLYNLLLNSQPTVHYGGFIVDVKQPYLSQYYRIHPELPKEIPILQTRYCSGRFYFLSRSAVSNLINKSEDIEKEYLEDYAIGYNLSNHFKTNMMNLKTNDYFKDIEETKYKDLYEKILS